MPESSEVFYSSIQVRDQFARETDRSSHALQKGKRPERSDLYSRSQIQSMKIPAATEAVDKEWGKLEIFGVELAKVKKTEVIEEARHKDVKVHFASKK